MHQQTQRTCAIGEAEGGSQALVLLDVNLQAIATVETTADLPEDAGDDAYEPIRDVAVHGDQVIVLTTHHHPKGSGLQLLDLDGRFLRTIAAGRFLNPWAVAASHGRAFVIDDEERAHFNILCVIDIQSGDMIQRVPVNLGSAGASALTADGDEIYIASCRGRGGVVVLRLAGSEV